jgi:thioredoxin-related protein
MRKKSVFINICLLVLILFISNRAYSQQVNWFKIDTAYLQQKQESKKMFVDVYTDWCHWCKVMDRKTFSDPQVADYMNKNFICSHLDAESKETIVANGQSYEPKYSGSNYNKLAVELLHEQLAFPSFAFIDENGKSISVVPGYYPPDEFMKVLIYFNKNYYKQIKWDDFNKKYTLEGLLKEE